MGACCSTNTGNAPPVDTSPDKSEAEPAIWRLGAGALLAGNAMTLGLAISSVDAPANITLFIHIALLASVVIVFELLGWPLFQGAMEGLRDRQINFDGFFLIAVAAAVGASLVSMVTTGPVYFEVAAILLVIHGIGRRVGNARKRRGLAAARSFMPDDVEVRRRRTDGQIEVVAVEALTPGDRIVVAPGSTIPIDGVVHEGISLVEETEVTGESFAATRRPGDSVYAGTQPLDGVLEIETTAAVGQRLLDRVVDSVETAWQRPASWRRQAQQTIRWFVPLVLIAALATFAGWTLATDWTTGLFYALAVLLVACPCALGFAVPLAVWMTLGRWASRGLVAAHGQCVETLSRVDTVIFDKTGTLTETTPTLSDIVVTDDHDRDFVKTLIVAVESQVDHPVARALTRLQKDLPPPCCRPSIALVSTHLLAGLGVEAVLQVDGQRRHLKIGAPDLVDSCPGPSRLREQLQRLRSRSPAPSRTREVVVLLDDLPVALAMIDETPRAHVDQAIAQLKSMGIAVGLITGDDACRAARFDTDFRQTRSTPEDKQRHVQRLQSRGRTVLFVGDGVNDAAAMAQADVAIDVADGAPLASEVGDIRWSGDDLRAIVEAITSARDAFSVVRFNLGFATIYNVAGIALAAAGLLHPVVAAILMMTSSLFVSWKTTASLDPTAQSLATQG